MGLKKIASELIKNRFRGVKYQRWFENLYDIALEGLDVFGGDDVENSGETWVFKNVLAAGLSKNNKVVFDIGANIGEYTDMVAKSINNPGLKIYSFEPSHKTYEKLCANIMDDRVELCNFGLGERENNNVLLYSDHECSGMASLYKRQLEHVNVSMSNEESIHIKTVDDYCRTAGITHIHFMKVDVEGNELNVLKGAKKMIDEGRISAIQFEFGGTDIDSRVFFKDFWYLLNKKYRIFRILPDGIKEIKEYSQKWEIFQCMNYLAIKRRNR